MARFFGSAFDDTITPEFLSPLVVRDPLRGGGPADENDEIDGAGGNDTIDGGGGNDTIGGGIGDDLIRGGVGNDSLIGFSGNDVCYGGDGNDILNNLDDAWSSDTLFGDGGNDLFLAYAGTGFFYGGQGQDTFSGGNNDDAFFGDQGDDVLVGGLGNDFLVGGANNDSLQGGADADTLTGGDGADTLDGVSASGLGTVGNLDTLFGEGGNDVIFLNYFVRPGVGVLATDHVDGGTGNDLLDLGRIGTVYDCLVDLSTGALSVVDVATQSLFAATEAFLSIENLQAGAGNDTIYGGSVANAVFGGNGDDLILGGGGGDSMFGGEGNDQIHALIGDQAFGGGGVDVLLIEPPGEDVILNLATTLDIQGFEVIFTGEGQDQVTGSAADEAIYGGGGDDTVDGGDGSDSVHGWDGNDLLVCTGTGNDTFYGGTGNDRINLNSRTSLIGLEIDGGTETDTVDLIEGTVTLDTVARFTGIENLDIWQTVISGTSGDDNLDLGAFATMAFGAALGTTINGNDGNDRIAGSDVVAAADMLNGGAGRDTVIGFKGNDRVRGGTENDLVVGGSGKDILLGEDGDDILVGGKGLDRLFGGLGADRFYFISANESSGRRADVIEASAQVMAFEGAGAAAGDLIDLSQIDANTEVAGNQQFSFGGAGIGQVHVVDKGDYSVVLANTDSDARFEFRLLIQDGGILAAAYTAADFAL